MNVVRKIGPYLIGPTVWGSWLAFMAYGLWTGAWYGYLFAALSAVVVVIFLVTVYRAKRVMDEECLRLLSEIEKEDDDDSPAQ